MSESLRDQLLKAGLVRKFKAEAKVAPVPQQKKSQQGVKPPQQNVRPQHQAPKKPVTAQEPNLAHAYALRERQEKEDRERAQREAERQAHEKRERKQKLAALLNGKSLNAAEADVPRHFPHGNKIRRVYCTTAQLAQLNHGDLAVVQLAGRYLLVTREAALQAQAIDEHALVLLCDPNAPPEDDVPADLVW
ncbi:MAG: DUF2058 family protein [Rudaea sp.]